MLLKMYRKPVLFDNTLALEVLFWFKMALVLHSLMGLFMLSNSAILPTKEEVESLINYDDYIVYLDSDNEIIFSWNDLFSP